MNKKVLRIALVSYILLMTVVAALALCERLPVQLQRMEEIEAQAYDAAYDDAYDDAYVAAYEAAGWRVYLTAKELELVERIVEAECGNQPYVGQLAVAQCILDRMTTFGESVVDVVTAPLQFARPTDREVSGSVESAVYAVFHDGVRVSNEPILFFYSTAGGFVSEGHEKRNYLVTIEDHKFFN